MVTTDDTLNLTADGEEFDASVNLTADGEEFDASVVPHSPLPPVHGERYRRADGTCGCDLCRFGGESNIAAALRWDLPLGPIDR